MMKRMIYPGTFDPPTNGHLDIVKRGCKLCDLLIIVIASNPKKKHTFSASDRKFMWERILEDEGLAESTHVDVHDGLTVERAKNWGATAILRGLRAVSDFEGEFQLAIMNRKLDKNIQSVFLISGLKWIYTSSSLVKEAASFHADVSDMVHSCVNYKLMERFK